MMKLSIPDSIFRFKMKNKYFLSCVTDSSGLFCNKQKKSSGNKGRHPSFLSWLCPPSLLLICGCSKWSTHPLLLSCCHGNHNRVANGESQEKVQVRICHKAAAAANLLKQLPVWNHFSFLSGRQIYDLLETNKIKCISKLVWIFVLYNLFKF